MRFQSILSFAYIKIEIIFFSQISHSMDYMDNTIINHDKHINKTINNKQNIKTMLYLLCKMLHWFFISIENSYINTKQT